MLLAVLEKKCGFRLGAKDVFLNITGGIKIDDTASDLAIISSVFSSDQNIPLDMNICFAAEIGLSGELRAVNRIEERILEAEKLGYKQIIISKHSKISKKDFKIIIKQCRKIEEVFSLLF
jgi:DNA repair protein RadA/Sms